MDTLVRHIWNNKDPKEYAKYESTIIRLLNELDKDSTRHDNRMKFRSVQKQFLKSLDKNKTILLYLKDDEVVGLTLMVVSEGLVSTMSISDLIVDSKYRNKGYGSYILEDSINYAKERKFKNVCLQVFTNNTVAKNMYLKRGFKPVTEFMMLGLESMNTINKDTYILEIGNEDFWNIFKNKRKEKLKNVLKKYRSNVNISFSFYKEARNKLKDVLNKNNKYYNLEIYESVSKQDFLDFYVDSIYDIFEDNTNDPFIYSGDDGYIRIIDDESKLKKVIDKVLNELRSLDNKKYEFRYPQGHEIIEIWVNHNLSKQDLKNIYNEVYDDKANESLYNKSLFQYEYLLNYDFDTIALESFSSELLRIITGILDTVLKLLNNFKATVLGVFKDLKRTELQEFEDSNKTTLPRILKYPYEFLAQQNVVVPRGMIKPYKFTTEKIKGCLDVLDMVNRSEKALASVDNVLNMLMSNTKLQVKQDTIHVGELRSLEYIFKEENNCFSSFKRCEEQQFSKVFQSDHCLVDTYHLLLNTVIYEQDVSKVYSTLERIYQKFEQILRLVESKQVNLTKSDIITLAGQTTTLAKLFDMYGTVITDLQRVEHNFVLVLSSIAEKHGL